jgi:hypothetical protein
METAMTMVARRTWRGYPSRPNTRALPRTASPGQGVRRSQPRVCADPIRRWVCADPIRRCAPIPSDVAPGQGVRRSHPTLQGVRRSHPTLGCAPIPSDVDGGQHLAPAAHRSQPTLWRRSPIPNRSPIPTDVATGHRSQPTLRTDPDPAQPTLRTDPDPALPTTGAGSGEWKGAPPGGSRAVRRRLMSFANTALAAAAAGPVRPVTLRGPRGSRSPHPCACISCDNPADYAARGGRQALENS